MSLLFWGRMNKVKCWLAHFARRGRPVVESLCPSVELERQLSRQGCLLLLQRTWVWFPTPVAGTPEHSNASCRRYRPSSALRGCLQAHGAHKFMQTNNKQTVLSLLSTVTGIRSLSRCSQCLLWGPENQQTLKMLIHRLCAILMLVTNVPGGCYQKPNTFACLKCSLGISYGSLQGTFLAVSCFLPQKCGLCHIYSVPKPLRLIPILFPEDS